MCVRVCKFVCDKSGPAFIKLGKYIFKFMGVKMLIAVTGFYKLWQKNTAWFDTLSKNLSTEAMHVSLGS